MVAQVLQQLSTPAAPVTDAERWAIRAALDRVPEDRQGALPLPAPASSS